MEHLHIRLFGPFEVYRDEAVIEPHAWGRRKTQDMLKVLAEERGRVFAQEELIEAFFPELDPDKARANLQARVSRLRKALEPDLDRGDASQFIERVGDGYRLHPDAPCWVDVEAFLEAIEAAKERERAQRWTQAARHYDDALALYRGEYLADDPYAEWAIAPRERYRQLRLEALERLAECHVQLGQYQQAIERCRQALDAEPYRESAHRRLMLAHAYAGNEQMALRVYEACQAALHEHYDAEPAPETQELADQIRRGKVARPSVATPHNLPAPISRFIGRQQELEEVQTLIHLERLVTLTGTGGSGKSRLAIEVASQALDRFPDGVWFVDMAPLSDPRFVPEAAMSALGIQGSAEESPTEALIDHLQVRRALLLLDNCEHLIEGCAELATELLHECPDVTVLTTSRQPLGLTGEVSWEVPPLALPWGVPTEDRLSHYDAVALFMDRARAQQPDLRLTSEIANPVLTICRELDGLPLAIELAAARVKTLRVAEIADRLHERFELLTSGSRTALPRHRTLQATLDWSHELLSEGEKALLRRLSVFAGGFTLGAAEAVCTDEAVPKADVLKLLSGLVEQSLVTFHGDRYGLLETVRQYAREMLVEAGELDATEQRHFSFFYAWAQQAETEYLDGDVFGWLKELERELDNLRHAFQWAHHQGHRRDAFELVTALWPLWFLMTPFRVGRQWLEEAFSQVMGTDVPAPTLARALCVAGMLIAYDGDDPKGKDMLEKGLTSFRQQGDRQWVARGLAFLGLIETEIGRYCEAQRFWEDILTNYKEDADQHVLSRAFVNLGEIYCLNGNMEYARELIDKSIELAQQYDHNPYYTLFGLGKLAYARGELHRAQEFMQTAIARVEETGTTELPAALRVQLAEVTRCRPDHEQAEHYLQEAETHFEATRYRHGQAMVQIAYARLALDHEDLRRSKTHLDEAMRICRQHSWQIELASCLEAWARWHLHAGAWKRSTKLFGAVDNWRVESGMGKMPMLPHFPDGPEERQQRYRKMRQKMGDTTFQDAYQTGRNLSLDQAVETLPDAYT